MSFRNSFNALPNIFFGEETKMSNSLDEMMKKKLKASNDPIPTHSVEMLNQNPLLTSDFDVRRAQISKRYKKYQATIDNFRKSLQ